VLFDYIPAELRELPQWVVWSYELRDDDWTKPPFNARTGRKADTTKPATWSTFDEARAAYARGGWDGIGCVHLPKDGMTVADCDKCRDPATGEIQSWALAVVRKLNSYTEVSPSGCGLRTVAFGRKPTNDRSRKGPFEIYDSSTKDGKPGGRYLTFTGHHLSGTPKVIDKSHAAIKEVYDDTFGTRKPPTENGSAKKPATGAGTFPTKAYGGECPLPLTEDELARWDCIGADKTAKIRALWGGDISAHGDDDSRADLALVKYLLILTNGGRSRAESLFNHSALGRRDKWKVRSDYRDRTFDTAEEGFTPWGNDPANNVTGKADTPDGAQPQTGCQIIRDYFLRRYRPVFRDGKSIRAADGREVQMSEACVVPDSVVIAALEHATDAPKANDSVKISSLPGFFRKWAAVAWGDLLNTLPDEDEADLGTLGSAREEFHRMVRDVMLSEVTLGEIIRAGTHRADARTERNSLAGWCVKFAREGPWRSIRGKLCWVRKAVDEHGEVYLQIAINQGLFAQMKAERSLTRMTPTKFAKRAKRYGLGESTRDERPHGYPAVVLDRKFVAELIGTGIPEDDSTEPVGVAESDE
jgi:hypothetical protein